MILTVSVASALGKFRDIQIQLIALVLCLAIPGLSSADDSIPIVDLLTLANRSVLVDARPLEDCRESTLQGALCFPMSKVLSDSGRLANMRDLRWLLGTYGLTGSENVVVFADQPAHRDVVSVLFFLAGQSKVSRLSSAAELELQSRGSIGALSRQAFYIADVRSKFLESVKVRRVNSADFSEFTRQLGEATQPIFYWPASFIL
ncbi:MAG: hypothetical protein GY922_02870 [Proteobacteria bacterium]|nr:hypothetical protein [Pseudomonadota bacterium]